MNDLTISLFTSLIFSSFFQVFQAVDFSKNINIFYPRAYYPSKLKQNIFCPTENQVDKSSTDFEILVTRYSYPLNIFYISNIVWM